jgi:hypothetical protein
MNNSIEDIIYETVTAGASQPVKPVPIVVELDGTLYDLFIEDRGDFLRVWTEPACENIYDITTRGIRR